MEITSEKYYTHDNGGLNFQVEIESGTQKKVNIYRIETLKHFKSLWKKVKIDKTHDYGFDLETFDQTNIFNYENREMIRGKSPLLSYSDFERVFIGQNKKLSKNLEITHDPTEDGNSVLVKLTKLEYVHIGIKIFQFTAENEIVKYNSEIGNSDVPYPWAEDVDGNCYLMIENVVVMKNDRKLYEPNGSPYTFYYHLVQTDRCGQLNIKSDISHPIFGNWLGEIVPLLEIDLCIKEGLLPDSDEDGGSQKNQETNVINPRTLFPKHEFYIGRWSRNPGKTYDRISESSSIQLVFRDGSTKSVNKEEYINWINSFSEKIGVKEITNKKTLIPRPPHFFWRFFPQENRNRVLMYLFPPIVKK
jgi:hypothetical protein